MPVREWIFAIGYLLSVAGVFFTFIEDDIVAGLWIMMLGILIQSNLVAYCKLKEEPRKNYTKGVKVCLDEEYVFEYSPLDDDFHAYVIERCVGGMNHRRLVASGDKAREMMERATCRKWNDG